MSRVPLAERMRPQKLDEVIGQDAIIGKGKILTEIVKKAEPVNLIFWGPPGTGKTTLARILAKEFQADFVELSAVTAKKADIETVVERAKVNWNLKTRTVLFVDEIHRFNKAQQDAFLPHVESGLIILIGATTENPSFEVISPLISRSRVVIVSALKKPDIMKVLERAVKAEKAEKRVTPEALEYIADLSAGDARSALGDLELSLSLAKKVDKSVVETAVGKKMPLYDKSGDYHYDNISAFIKSMRGSDVDATLYYLARMVQSGEDPKFIARRLVISASEDIGLANPNALLLANAAFDAVAKIGWPEGRIPLAEATVYLAASPKSNSAYLAIDTALELVRRTGNQPVPLPIRNAPTKLMKDLGYSDGYKYPHDYPGHFTPQQYMPDSLTGERLWHCQDNPSEDKLHQRMMECWGSRFEK